MKATLSKSILEARLQDAVKGARDYSRTSFIGFLTEEEAAFAKSLMNQMHFENYMLWGGYPNSERVVFGSFPDYMEPDSACFPVAAITATYRRCDVLRHQDFLGALMSRGIKRDTLGDFLLEEGRCVFFVREEIREYLFSQIEMVGKVGVRLSREVREPLPAGHKLEDFSAVVASPRMDAVVSATTGVSRAKAAEWIKMGYVFLNHEEVSSVSQNVNEQDLLSIRGKGRYRFDQIGPMTKKGRLKIAGKKYV